MTRKTKKYSNKNKTRSRTNNTAFKSRLKKCTVKTCRAKKYQSVYGGTQHLHIRAPRQLFF